MPLNKKIALISTAVFISIGIFIGNSFLTKKNSVSTSVPIDQNKILISQFSSKGVGDRIIKLKLTADSAKLNSETSSVQVDIEMPFDFSAPLFFKWKLGEGVTLLEGDLTGQINGLLKLTASRLRINVKGFSQEANNQIGFEIYGAKNGRKIYGDAILSSVPENTFEDIVQNVEKIKSSH